MAASFLKSKLFVFFGVAALFLSLSFLGKELYKKYQVRQEVHALEQEIEKMNRQNQDLTELIGFLKTPEYRERQARSVLNLQKPGEIAVALPQRGENKPEEQVGEAVNSSTDSNLKKWWDYFFKK